MKFFRICILIISFLCVTNGQETPQKKTANIKTYEAEGNLKQTEDLTGLTFSTLKNSMTPPDIYKIVAEYLKQGKYEEGAKLFIAATVYGRFDQFRVKDKSAHQAMTVLKLNMFEDLQEEFKTMFDSVKSIIGDNGPKLKTYCDSLRAKGHPTYYPTYMIQHGLGAFTKSNEEAIDNSLKPDSLWNSALDSYLHCKN